MLEFKGCIVSIDAMGCQRGIAAQIRARDADYVLAVKDNQPKRHAAIDDYFRTARAAAFAHLAVDRHEETDAGHGRCEVRRCYLVGDLRTLPEPERWAGLRSIAMVETERRQGEQVGRETRYYITSLAGSARQVAEAVRAHWGIENCLHWVLDVTFREDGSRIRREHAPANFNTLRQFARNLLQRQGGSDSIERRRFQAALDDDFRAKVVFGQ
jgi:predicted transposase YbfD/YdcC